MRDRSIGRTHRFVLTKPPVRANLCVCTVHHFRIARPLESRRQIIEIEVWKIVIIALGHALVSALSIAAGGGSSFINQPFMILMGLPPKQAIATDIISEAVSEITAIWQYTDGIFILRKRVTVTNLLVDVYFTF